MCQLWKRDIAPSALVGLKNSTGIVAGSNNGAWLAMARDDKTIEVIDLNTRQVAHKIPAATANVTLLGWTPDDQALYSVSADNNVTRRQLPASGAAAGTAAQGLTFAAPSICLLVWLRSPQTASPCKRPMGKSPCLLPKLQLLPKPTER